MEQITQGVIVNTDKAYLLGLIVGGGDIIGQRLTISLPYRNWGDLRINPSRGGDISNYIVRVAKPMWDSEYGMDIDYSVLNGLWQISGTITDSLQSDLAALGLPLRGNFREQTSLAVMEQALNNQEKIKRFIAGLTDTVGSLAPSHRHRVDSFQIISYEFTGQNFLLVSQLVRLFDSIGCYPDQILWNHPNFHSSTNRYYSSWKKGFKLRIALKDYMLKGSFVSEAKKLSAQANSLLGASSGISDHGDTVRINGRTTLHKDEYSEWLPSAIRGRHFVHYAHLGYVLGMPTNTTTLNYLRDKLKSPGSLVCPFTILTKGTRTEIESIIENEEYLRKSSYSSVSYSGNFLSKQLDDPEAQHIFGLDNDRGFPITQVVHAATYVALAESDKSQLFGKRIKGDRFKQFRAVESKLAHIGVEILRPNKGTCLLVRSKNYAALVGYVDDDFNNRLITYDEQTLMLSLREPAFEDCVELA